MLVLTRKPGERLFIEDPATGRRIMVQLVKVMHGGGCRIGIDAPLDLAIRREEIPALAVVGNTEQATLPRTAAS